MSIRIAIPGALRQFAGGSSEFEVEASTAGEALERLVAEHGALRQHLFDDKGSVRSFVNVYVGDEDIRYKGGLGTALKDGDSVLIIPSIAGGCDCCGDGSSAAARPRLGAELTSEEYVRYGRHLILAEVGVDGQRALKGARVLLVGTGGLGAPAGMYLAAAGVGTIGLVDFDTVDLSNLQRQIIHGTKDVGRPKIASAADRLKDINPNVHIESYETRLTSANALEILRDYDVIVDGTDNFPTRYLVNDACVLLGKPNVYGSIFRFEGQASVFWASANDGIAPGGGACYRCLYPDPPPPGLVPSCAEAGVLGVLPGIIGSIQATETIKLILGSGDTLVNRLLTFDAWKMSFRELKLHKAPGCPICGEHATIRELVDYEQFCGLKRPASAPAEASPEEITAAELKRLIDQGRDLQIIDVREPNEFAIGRIPGSRLIPLGEVVERRSEIDISRYTVVHCKGGARSAKAIAALKAAGFAGELVNLKGGILAWSTDVDPSVPKY